MRGLSSIRFSDLYLALSHFYFDFFFLFLFYSYVAMICLISYFVILDLMIRFRILIQYLAAFYTSFMFSVHCQILYNTHLHIGFSRAFHANHVMTDRNLNLNIGLLNLFERFANMYLWLVCVKTLSASLYCWDTFFTQFTNCQAGL